MERRCASGRKEARLTAYDACYVALARQLGVVLVTEDPLIRRNGREVARALKVFLGSEDGPAAVRERTSRYQADRRKRNKGK